MFKRSKDFTFLIAIIPLTWILFNCTPDKLLEIETSENKVILSANTIPYDSLSEVQKNKIIGCFYYRHHIDYMKTEHYDKESSHFVITEINNALLAKMSESRTFGIDKLLTNNVYSLYGKYHNKWVFYDKDGSRINNTNKFAGHNIFEITRINSIDHLIIGPLPSMPVRMEIEIFGDAFHSKEIPKRIIDK